MYFATISKSKMFEKHFKMHLRHFANALLKLLKCASCASERLFQMLLILRWSLRRCPWCSPRLVLAVISWLRQCPWFELVVGLEIARDLLKHSDKICCLSCLGSPLICSCYLSPIMICCLCNSWSKSHEVGVCWCVRSVEMQLAKFCNCRGMITWYNVVPSRL